MDDRCKGHSLLFSLSKYITLFVIFISAEYITSLAKLSWMTFSSAVTEKFCDLYWEEELLEMLYETINGEKPSKPDQQKQPG